jgi:hypothetical protein
MNRRLEQMRWFAVILAGLALTSCGQQEQPTPAPETVKILDDALHALVHDASRRHGVCDASHDMIC